MAIKINNLHPEVQKFLEAHANVVSTYEGDRYMYLHMWLHMDKNGEIFLKRFEELPTSIVNLLFNNIDGSGKTG